ncbi:LacI family DNA-binding transcriptional regulator [bacterium]|nr:LacI family DNA-binding transcriptional regulator [bacterium]
MKKVTMQTIADELGVSKSLVSLTLNDKYGVSSEMRYTIFRKALELDFDFNYKYKNRSKDSKRKICIFINRDHAIKSSYFGKFIEGAEKAFIKDNYKYELIFWNNDSTPKDLFEHLALKDVKGIIVLHDLKTEILDIINKLNIPIVFADEDHYLNGKYTSIRTNNYLCGVLCASYLYKQGHRHIAFLGAIKNKLSYGERFYGAKNIIDLYNSQNKDDKAYIYYIKDTKSIEDELARLQAMTPRATAVICVTKIYAKKAIDTLKKYNQYKTKNLSIIAVDDCDVIPDFLENITSIKHSVSKIGECAARTIIDNIEKKDLTQKTILCEVEMVEGTSTINLKEYKFFS